MKQTTRIDVSIFALLIVLGVAGRMAQPAWCVTPLAGATLLAGYLFASPLVAALIPLAILAITDGYLPGYASHGVMLAVYGAALFPVLLGRMLRRRTTVCRVAGAALLPAVVFYVTTNFGVWAFQDMYPKTLAGLFACYAAAVPFFRNMLAGDIFYTSLLLSCAYLATASWPRTAAVPAGKDSIPPSGRD